MVKTAAPIPELNFEGEPLPGLATLPESDPTLGIGSSVLQLDHLDQQSGDSLGAVMKGNGDDEQPSLDPRDPRFEEVEEETEAGMPVHRPDLEDE